MSFMDTISNIIFWGFVALIIIIVLTMGVKYIRQIIKWIKGDE